MRVKNGAYQLDAPFKVDVPKTLTSFYLRMRSNGVSGQAAYSTNGTDWTDVGKARDISDVVSGSTLGPLALRGGAATPVTAKFDYFRVRSSPVAACTANGTVESGYERLWNGIDLTGTTQAGPGGFNIVNDGAEGCRLVSQGGLGLLWFNAKTYDNFVLRTQFKTADDTDNSGIFVRFPNPGTDPNVAIAQGHEIQIREGVAGDGEDQKTGSVYNFKRETARAAKPAGQWNDYEIRYEAGKYTITLNGTVVNTWHEQPPAGQDRPATSACRTTAPTTRSRSATSASSRSRRRRRTCSPRSASRARTPAPTARSTATRRRTRCRRRRCRRRARSARRPTTPPTTCRCGCPTRPAPSRTWPRSTARR